jgi:polysaccharide deacetylase family protein (PEP-CTERM system associated)
LAAVEAASQQQIAGYRAPMFSINGSVLWALQMLHDLGFRYDSSVFPTRNMLYGYPEAPRFPYHPLDNCDFVEFPLSTVRFLGVNWPLAGGFYLRLLPYQLFKKGLDKLNREGKFAIIYLHPWELDPDHPHPNPTAREMFTHYYNLDTTATKLANLLHDFPFAPLNRVYQEMTGPGRPKPCT